MVRVARIRNCCCMDIVTSSMVIVASIAVITKFSAMLLLNILCLWNRHKGIYTSLKHNGTVAIIILGIQFGTVT